MNDSNELKMTPANFHSTVAEALDFTFVEISVVALATQLAPTMELPIPVGVLAKLIASNLLLASLCVKHGLVDQGALESVWAERLNEARVRSHSRRLTSMVKHASEVEIRS